MAPLNLLSRQKQISSFVIIILFGLLFSTELSAKWKRSSGIPAGFENKYYLEVYFLPQNQNYAWICGFEGITLRSTDRGKTWKASVIPGNYQLESIIFVDENVGYTSGELNDGSGMGVRGVIFKSTDGGVTWKNITPPQATSLWGNFFINPNVGVVVGNSCNEGQMFHRTTDGGNTWNTFHGMQIGSALCDVRLFDPNGLGYATSSGLLWVTRNGGLSWSILSGTGGYDWEEELAIYNNTSFLIPYSTGCTGNEGGGGLRFSVDGGKNWRDFSTGRPMFGAFLKDEVTGWGVGWDRTVIYTTNGGRTWTDDNCGIEGDLDDIWFLNDTTGWVVGEGVFEYTLEPDFPPIIAGNFPVTLCEGDTLTLSTTRNFSAYKWSTGENTSKIKVTKPGKYWVYGYNSKCDSGTSAPIEVFFTPRPKPLISSIPENVCEGDTMTLTTSEEFQNYTWNTGEKTRSIIVTKPGKYSLKASNSQGCVGEASFDAVFNPRPSPRIVASQTHRLCIGDTVRLSGDRPYTSYLWMKDGVEISRDPEITVTQTGNYNLQVANEFGCVASSNELFLDIRLDSNRLEVEFIKDLDGKLNFGDVLIPKGSCRNVIIRNISNSDVALNDAYVFNNRAFSIPQSQYPIIIPAKSERELTICFTPDSLGLLRDSAFVADVCDDHFIHLTGEAESAETVIGGPCGIEILVTPVDYEPNSFFRLSAPSPNPAEDRVRLNYETNLAASVVNKVNIELYSFMGEQMPISKTIDGSSIDLSLENIPAGAYRLKISLGGNTKFLNFVKN